VPDRCPRTKLKGSYARRTREPLTARGASFPRFVLPDARGRPDFFLSPEGAPIGAPWTVKYDTQRCRESTYYAGVSSLDWGPVANGGSFFEKRRPLPAQASPHGARSILSDCLAKLTARTETRSSGLPRVVQGHCGLGSALTVWAVLKRK
jgi:hypothetical protein